MSMSSDIRLMSLCALDRHVPPAKTSCMPRVVARGLAVTNVKVTEQVVMDLQRAQSLEQLGDADVFFSSLDGEASKQPLRREVFKRLLLRGRNRSHTPPCGLPPLSFC